MTALVGMFSGAMIAVFVGVMVRYVTNGPVCAELPICDWNKYAMIGGVIGLVTLPSLTFWRLRHSEAGARSSDRG